VSAARRARFVLTLALVACGGDDTTARPPAAALDSAPSSVKAESTAAALDQWNTAEVRKRLEEAGLVVADSGEAPPVPPLAEPGDRLFVSGSELRLFVFDDAASLERASAGLDTTAPPLGYTAAWQSHPRVYVVNNLVALLYTPNDRLAERVENVLRARHVRRE
jgi:hypothetical protein